MSRFIETSIAREFVAADQVTKIKVSCKGEGTTLHLRDGTTVQTGEADGMALAYSSTYIPAEPGWRIQFHEGREGEGPTIGRHGCKVCDEPHPIIGWALPSGMPIIAQFGVVFVGAGKPCPTIIRPDGKRLRWDNKKSRWEWETPE